MTYQHILIIILLQGWMMVMELLNKCKKSSNEKLGMGTYISFVEKAELVKSAK